MKLAKILAVARRRIGQEIREAAYLRTGVDVTKPLAIRALPTERCNYKCPSCDCWRRVDYPAELTLEAWQQALAGVRKFVGPCTVQFSGGEPFAYRSFLPLVEWCSRHHIDWGMISNGSAFTDGNVERIVQARPLNVDVSVDGASSSVHDASRGVVGSLDHVARGVQALRTARDRAGGSFPIRVKPTIHRRNVHEATALVEWARNAGATSIDFSPVRPWTREVAADLWMRPDDEHMLDEAVEALIAAKRAGAPIETEESRMRSWQSHFRGENIRPAVAPCRAGLRDFHILPSGDVRMCWEYPPIGNVTRSSPRDIWYGATAVAQRTAMMACPNFGSTKCASSCMSHRTMRQDWMRLKIVTRRSR